MTVVLNAALVAANRHIAVPLRMAAAACWSCGTVAFLGVALSLVLQATGAPALTPVSNSASAHTLPLAIAIIALEGFFPALAVALALMLARFALRGLVLRDTDAALGIVESSTETLLSIEHQPVLIVSVAVETPAGRFVAIARQRFEAGGAPRSGDLVRIALSRLDPACCRIIGTVSLPATRNARVPLPDTPRSERDDRRPEPPRRQRAPALLTPRSSDRSRSAPGWATPRAERW